MNLIIFEASQHGSGSLYAHQRNAVTRIFVMLQIFNVAQIFNLLNRVSQNFILQCIRPIPTPVAVSNRADCKSAIQQIKNLRYGSPNAAQLPA